MAAKCHESIVEMDNVDVDVLLRHATEAATLYVSDGVVGCMDWRVLTRYY